MDGDDEIIAVTLWRWLAPRLRRIALPLVAGHALSIGAYIVGAVHAAAVFDPSQLIGHPSDGPLVGPSGLYAWDADSYARIAGSGYPTAPGDHLDAFLPFYPLLMRIVMTTGLSAAVAGVAVSLVAKCVALIAVDMLVSRERDERTALFAVWLLALAPMGVFLSAVYTESTFIAAAAVSLCLMRRGRFVGASIAAMVAGATRITGIVLGPVLLLEWVLRQVRRRREEGAGMPALRDLMTVPLFALPIVPFLLFSLYLGAHTGDLGAYHDAQVGPSFNHDIAWPWKGFSVTYGQLQGTTDPETHQTWLREVVYGACGAVLCVAAWLDLRMPRSLALYCSLVFVVSTSISFWLSVPRYMLGIFPVVIVVADLTQRERWARPVIVLASGWLFLWSAFMYGTGHWVA